MGCLSLVMITGFEPALRPGEHGVHQASEIGEFYALCTILLQMFDIL